MRRASVRRPAAQIAQFHSSFGASSLPLDSRPEWSARGSGLADVAHAVVQFVPVALGAVLFAGARAQGLERRRALRERVEGARFTRRAFCASNGTAAHQGQLLARRGCWIGIARAVSMPHRPGKAGSAPTARQEFRPKFVSFRVVIASAQLAACRKLSLSPNSSSSTPARLRRAAKARRDSCRSGSRSAALRH